MGSWMGPMSLGLGVGQGGDGGGGCGGGGDGWAGVAAAFYKSQSDKYLETCQTL